MPSAARKKQGNRSTYADTGHARNYADIGLEYAKRAAADKQQVEHCKWVRLAAQRHLDDLKRSRSKSWGFYFDPWHANDICDFIEKLPHVEGRWETPTLTLEPPQIFILTTVFGWRVKGTGFRRFTDVYIEMARKGAKSTLTAGVVLYCTFCEDEPGPLALIGATTGEQARKVFKPAQEMVRRTPDMQEAFGAKSWSRSITSSMNGGTIQTINARGSTQDGHNPHIAVLDELHAHKDRGLYDVIHSADGARPNPLYWKITTAGVNVHGVCYERRSFGTKVLERSIIAEHAFVIIFTIDGPKDFTPERKVGDDPFDERTWFKANPLMPITPSIDSMRRLAISAQSSPGEETEFKTKRLNVWTGAAAAWLSTAQWIACSDPGLRLRDFRGLDCYIGADLADKDDITAVVLAAIDPDGRLLLKCWFFLPEVALSRVDPASKQIVELYRGWKKSRHLWTTPGDFVDHNRVEQLIRRLSTALAVKRVTFDHFAAAQAMASRLNEDLDSGDGNFASILQKNAFNVTDPAKDLEARVKAGPHKLRHDANPVMTWMAGNVVVHRHVNGSILPKKETPMSLNKIDGIDAAVNAIAPVQLPPPEDDAEALIRSLAA